MQTKKTKLKNKQGDVENFDQSIGGSLGGEPAATGTRSQIHRRRSKHVGSCESALREGEPLSVLTARSSHLGTCLAAYRADLQFPCRSERPTWRRYVKCRNASRFIWEATDKRSDRSTVLPGHVPTPHRGRFAIAAPVETPNVSPICQAWKWVSHEEKAADARSNPYIWLLGHVSGAPARQIHDSLRPMKRPICRRHVGCGYGFCWGRNGGEAF
jgi:hypothetical protein